MAEDGTGGLVYLKRVGGVAHVFVSRYIGGRWLRADPGRHRRAVRRQLAADRRCRRRRADRRLGDAVRDRTRPARLRAARRRRSAPGSRRFGQPIIVDPDIREATGTSPRSGGQLDRPGGRRLPGRATARARRPAAAPRRRRRERPRGRTSTANAGRRSGPSTATRASRCARRPTPTRRRSRSARPATASSSGRSRKARGVARIWARRIFGRTLNYVMPVSATTFNGSADHERRRRAARGDLAPRPGRGRLPPAGWAPARRCRARGSS